MVFFHKDNVRKIIKQLLHEQTQVRLSKVSRNILSSEYRGVIFLDKTSLTKAYQFVIRSRWQEITLKSP